MGCPCWHSKFTQVGKKKEVLAYGLWWVSEFINLYLSRHWTVKSGFVYKKNHFESTRFLFHWLRSRRRPRYRNIVYFLLMSLHVVLTREILLTHLACQKLVIIKLILSILPWQSYFMAKAEWKVKVESMKLWFLLTLVNSGETLVGAFPSLRLDLDAPRLSEILWLPPLGAAPHSAPCAGDLDSVPLENFIDLQEINIFHFIIVEALASINTA